MAFGSLSIAPYKKFEAGNRELFFNVKNAWQRTQENPTRCLEHCPHQSLAISAGENKNSTEMMGESLLLACSIWKFLSV
jgi:hypothetical protein